MNIIDLTGQKINEWTVIEYAGNQMWKCKCSCGKIKLIDGQNLRSKTAKSCGHDAREDLTGLLFGSWKVISPAENYSWLCECQCPLHTRRVVLASSLKKGRSKSCGNRTYHPAVRSDNKSKNNETNEVVKIRHWSQESIQNKINKVSPYTVGAIFGTWEIKNKVDNRYYECVCKECGLEKTLTTSGLWNARNNDSKCNHLKTCTSVKVGDVFGRLKVIAIDHSYSHGRIYKCECLDCGNTRIYSAYALTTGQSKSCGCNKSITKLSEQEVNAALVNYGLEHEDNKPMPNELAKKLGIGKSTMNSYIKRYELYDKFNHGSSTAENEIYELLSKYCDVKPHDRSILKPLEIDVFLLEHNIGIEFDGNFWHDENHKKAGYHQEKTINANKKGIRLVHIFEYEWIENREMIEKFLIDLVSKKCAYHARNLELREITAHDANEFYKENHIQGGTRSSTINIGLYTNTNVLVAALSLGSPRFDTSSHYEIIRYCVKYGVAISGAFNKMLKYFEDKYNPKSVLTYSDASKFTADVYRNAGFNDLGITQPGYRWVKQNWPSLSRYQTQKHKLVADGLGREDQTENEIMAGLGYTKIYDCGNYKLIKNY